MFGAVAEFTSTRQGDSTEFMEKVRALAIGVAYDREPARLYVIRIDNWFGPKWMHFAGKFTAGKGAAIGVHKTRLHVPPLVPNRVVAERVFVEPDYEVAVVTPPLHIECPSKQALLRQIADIDKNAAFLWFSGESEAQKRGSVMVYLPVATDPAFYVGFSQREKSWEPSMLRGVTRGEAAHLEESGRASFGLRSGRKGKEVSQMASPSDSEPRLP
jgi:hypothetical protein